MGVRVEATTMADLDDVSRLLCAAFAVPADSVFVDRQLLQWKCFGTAAALRTPCSYVLRQGESIVAHCGVVPMTLHVPARASGDAHALRHTASGMGFFDWAGDRRLPGVAVILLKKLMARGEVSIVPGGSAATRSVLPRIGFTVQQHVEVFARVIRPLRQARTRPITSAWRHGLRLARNTAWSFPRPSQPRGGWSAESVSHFSQLPEVAPDDCVVPDRDPEYLNHWLRCPAAAVSGFHILRGQAAVGYFVLSRAGGQCRVADLRVRRDRPSDLETAYRLAVHTAASDPATSEVVCTGSTPAVVNALRACGLRRRGGEPLFVHDPRGVLQDAPPLLWSMVDDDAAYVYDPANPYVT